MKTRFLLTNLVFCLLSIFCSIENFGQSLTYDLGLIDINTLPAYVTDLNQVIVHDNIAYLVVRQGQSKIFIFDGVNNKLIFEHEEGLTIIGTNSTGLFFRIGFAKLYFLDKNTQEVILLSCLDGNIDQTRFLGDKLIILTHDEELYISDATVQGTQKVHTFSSNSVDLGVVVNNRLLISEDGSNADKIWVTDGSVNGMQIISNIAPLSNFPPFHKSGELAYFEANGGGSSNDIDLELYVTDGTIEGTRALTDYSSIVDGINQVGSIYEYMPIEGGLLFIADTPMHGEELWFSNGTPEGTSLVLEIISGETDGFSIFDIQFATESEVVFFKVDEPGYNQELWISDGSSEGTKIILDIATIPNITDDWNITLRKELKDGIIFFELETDDKTSTIAQALGC